MTHPAVIRAYIIYRRLLVWIRLRLVSLAILLGWILPECLVAFVVRMGKWNVVDGVVILSISRKVFITPDIFVYVGSTERVLWHLRFAGNFCSEVSNASIASISWFTEAYYASRVFSEKNMTFIKFMTPERCISIEIDNVNENYVVCDGGIGGEILYDTLPFN